MSVDSFNTPIVIILFGSLTLLSFLTFSNPLKVNKRSNQWFSLFLLSWASFWLDEILTISGFHGLSGWIYQIVSTFRFMTPFLFYISIVSFTTPGRILNKKSWIHFIAPLLYVSVNILMANDRSNNSLYEILKNILIYLQIFIYAGISFLKIRKHKKNIESFSSNTYEINLLWLQIITSIILLMSVSITIYNFMTSLYIHPPAVINLLFLICVCFVAYYSLKQKEIFPKEFSEIGKGIMQNNPQTYTGGDKKKTISDEDISELKKQLAELMESRHPYMDSELTLIKLSELMEITPHQLSYLINTGFNRNFYQFINHYRVERAKVLLADKKYNHLSILGIAYESGFNSKTVFNTTFKKITHLTPSEYKNSFDL